MFHHMGMVVKDFPRSAALYEACLAPLHIKRLDGGEDWMVLGTDDNAPFLWLGAVRPTFWSAHHVAGTSPIHLAFSAPNREAVAAFHAIALTHGATDNGAPGPRKSWADFYSAFVLDADGNNIEATLRE